MDKVMIFWYCIGLAGGTSMIRTMESVGTRPVPFFTTFFTAVVVVLIGAELYNGFFSNVVIGIGMLIGLFWVASLLFFGLDENSSHQRHTYHELKERLMNRALKMFAIVGMLAMASSLSAQELQPQQQPRPKEWLANWTPINWEMEKIEKGIPTDTIFIHHTAWVSGATWQKLSDEQKKRLYDARYAIADRDPFVQGQPAHSGHFRFVDGKLVEVFYAYHWIVRGDGKVERLLDDKYVGWHAGRWAENMRSFGIVFDGDFSNTPPPKKALKAAAKLIAEYVKEYPTITRLKAHKDVRDTICPGAWYHAKDKKGRTGRERLMKMARVNLSE